jgi:hypothetical protein
MDDYLEDLCEKKMDVHKCGGPKSELAGSTSLAYPDGAWLTELASLSEEELVVVYSKPTGGLGVGNAPS